MDVGLTEVSGSTWWNSEGNSPKLEVMRFTFHPELKQVIVSTTVATNECNSLAAFEPRDTKSLH